MQALPWGPLFSLSPVRRGAVSSPNRPPRPRARLHRSRHPSRTPLPAAVIPMRTSSRWLPRPSSRFGPRASRECRRPIFKVAAIPRARLPPPVLRRAVRRAFGGRAEHARMPRSQSSALGSGVIVSGDGYILTNFHVIDGADDVRVEMTDGHARGQGGRFRQAERSRAVLKINATDLTRSPWAIRRGTVGDVVLAVGNPMGIGRTVTMGIISAKGRSTGVGDGGYEDFLQTDRADQSGNSGGAREHEGELVGSIRRFCRLPTATSGSDLRFRRTWRIT